MVSQLELETVTEQLEITNTDNQEAAKPALEEEQVREEQAEVEDRLDKGDSDSNEGIDLREFEQLADDEDEGDYKQAAGIFEDLSN